jgi:hypothetical protein
MNISFSPSPDYGPYGRERYQGEDLSRVSRADLRWYYFLGSFRMMHRGVDIGPPWTWVPLFDLIYGLRNAVAFTVGKSDVSRIDFTENAEAIDLALDGGEVRLLPTYTTSSISCSVLDFESGVDSFLRHELARVISEYPSLGQNGDVASLVASVRLDEA